MIDQAKKMPPFRRLLAKTVLELGPPPAPVHFRTVLPVTGWTADTNYHKGKFLIRLRKNLSVGEFEDAVIHELAHVYSWKGGAFRDDHDAVWGAWYAQIYCAIAGGH